MNLNIFANFLKLTYDMLIFSNTRIKNNRPIVIIMVVVLLLAAVSFVWQEPAVCHGRAQFAVRGAEPDPEP